MNPTLRLLFVLSACGALAVGTVACGKHGGFPPRPPAAVKTAVAVEMDTPVTLDAFGSTDDRASVDVVPQVSGVLLRTLIDDGSTVTNGQPLFLIDPSDYALRVRQAEGLLSADRANLELSRLTLERNRPMLDKKLISTQDFDTLKTRAEAAEAQLHVDEAMLDQARLNLTRCTVTAPLAGVCSKRMMDDGNLATAGMTRLTNIRSYNPINVEFSVSEQYLTVLRQALAAGKVPIKIHPRGDTNSYSGALEFLDNAVNPLTGTVLLRGQVPNPELKLWARQFVEVTVFAGTVHAAIMVPEGAVQFGKQGTYLFVVSSDNKAEMRPVTVGVRYNDLIQIIQGVAANERVVLLGQMMLFPGAPVAEAGQTAPPAGAAPTSGK